jgi:transposase
MHRHAIKDDQWERIKDMLPGQIGRPGVTATDDIALAIVFSKCPHALDKVLLDLQ